ncbi:hypothetical protein, partial [Chromobacterium haemolyticum]|uniref:hypothetical protein n=1 Tax=Chromobacterium haemolyticum TaxID=394935 RepID=UPI001C4E0B3C
FGLLEKANDLFFGESALLHVRHSPSVTDFSLLLIGKAQGEQITWSWWIWLLMLPFASCPLKSPYMICFLLVSIQPLSSSYVDAFHQNSLCLY